MKTPIALIIFNRPEETARVFTEIRHAQPSKLFIIADGPRSAAERPHCEAARAIIETVDWPCEVYKNFSEENLGCGKRIVSGLNWVFEQVEEAIVLEDDCIPDPTFFPFCTELLEKYRDDTRVMHIAGTCMQENNRRFKPDASYYFSIMPNLWGWATWRRAWNLYDFDMKAWPEAKKSGALVEWFSHPAAYERFSKVFDRYYRHEENNWDNQWVFACCQNHGLCINPSINLITNIGFNDLGTHFKGQSSLSNRLIRPMHFPLIHPTTILANRAADAFKYRDSWDIDNKFYLRILRPFKTMFPGLYVAIKRFLGR